jgi:hypothetical protein
VAQPIATLGPGRLSQARKHYLLYALRSWKDTRVILAVLVVVYLGLAVYQYAQKHRPADLLVGLTAVLFAVLALPLVYGYTRRNYVVFDDDNLRLRVFLRSAEIPYTEIEKIRVDSMEKIFDRPENAKRRSNLVRKLYKERALVIKLRPEGGAPEMLLKRFGPRTVMERDLVLPVTETDLAYTTLKERLSQRRTRPEPVAAARGGRSRRRRR